MPSLTQIIRPNNPLHRMLLNACEDRIRMARTNLNSLQEQWRDADKKSTAYVKTRDVDRLRGLEREAGKPQFTTLSIPYTYGMLMSAHTYWTTVFLARNPVLQVTGRHGESQQAVNAVEALLDYQVQQAGMLVPLTAWLFDVGKYGLGILGHYWDERYEQVAEIREVPILSLGGFAISGKTRRERVRKRLRTYAGNRLYNVRPLDFFPDTRLPFARFQEGEFCGVRVDLGWNQIIKRAEQGYYMNEDVLRTNRRQHLGEREESGDGIELPPQEHFAPDGVRDEHTRDMMTADNVELYEVYIELIPSEWHLGQSDFPEKWVFTCTSDFKLLIGATPMGNLHNRFPFEVLPMEPEVYGLGSRGIPELVKDLQNTLDWLLNSHMYNVRKALQDQFIFDPSRVEVQDLLNPTPGNLVRLKPAAYGQDPQTVIRQLAVTDVTAGHLRDMELVMQQAQRTTGISDQIMGLVQGGSSRRTATEVRTSSSFGINRLKTAAEYFSATGWAPLATALLKNTQQFYDQSQQLRIVGDLALSSGTQFMQVTPEDIVGAFDFVPVDGTLPIDRYAQANLWREIMAQMRNFPELVQIYSIPEIFAWVAQLAGLKNIHKFRLDLQDPGVLAQQAQQGNMVPLRVIGEGAGPQVGNPPEPGQIAGLGATG